MSIEIVNQQKLMNVPEEKIRAVLRHVMLEELGHEVNVSVAIVTDKRIAELNKAFLNHIGPTDVLAFPFGEGHANAKGEDVFGEIVISAERARQEARRRNIDPEIELILYALHGMLHLAGYDNRSIIEEQEMRRREAEVLRALATRKGGGKGT
jgi:probable rRNA maturation factor